MTGLSDKDMCRLEMECARNIAPTIDRANVLQYAVVRQVLWGRIGGRDYGPVSGVSGAGQDGVTPQSVKFRDWSPRRKASASDGSRGGAIVPGWWIVLPDKLAKGRGSPRLTWGSAPTAMSLRVVPYALDSSYEDSMRNGFYIHGTGGKGSDGCILLAPTHRHALVDRVAAAGGAWLHAFVSGIELNEALEQGRTMADFA